MALLTCDFFSEALEVGTSLTVVLPQATTAQVGVDPAAVSAAASTAVSTAAGDGPPLLYLLHGRSDDHTAWLRYTSIERYAAAAGIAVVMPAAGRSFYADEAHGHRYWTYVAEELPGIVRSFFRVSQRPEDTWVAGLSMGGYGALKLAFTHPERYAGAASLSGALDVVGLASTPHRSEELTGRVFGGMPGPSDDLFALLDAAAPGVVPPLHLSCGTGDELLGSSEEMARRAAARGVDVTTDFRPGEHEWGLWDDVIRDVITWLPRPARGR